MSTEATPTSAAEVKPTPETPATPPAAAAPAEGAPKTEAAPEATPAEAKTDPKVEPGKEPAKEKAEEAAKPAVPEKYEFKMPEQSKLSAEHLKDVEAYAKENGLTQEQAQKVLERDNSLVASVLSNIEKAHAEGGPEYTKRVQTYESQILSDKEIGGEHMKANVELASRVVKKFADPAFGKDLNATGFGSHPGLVKMLVHIGKAMGEDSFESGAPAGDAPKSAAETLYPSMAKKK